MERATVMAQILIKATARIGSGDISGNHYKGDIIGAFPDGHTFGTLEGPPGFVIVGCPVDVDTARAYLESWDRTIDYTVLSSNNGTGTYQLELFGNNVSTSGGAKITRDHVESFLTGWNSSVDSFGDNSVIFTINLWQSLQSERFWETGVSAFTFSLPSYDPISGVAVVTVSGFTDDKQIASATRKIEGCGGTVTGGDSTSVVFQINRSDVIQKFRDDVQQSARASYMRKKYYIDPAVVDQVLAAGGIISTSTANVLAALKNRLEE